MSHSGYARFRIALAAIATLAVLGSHRGTFADPAPCPPSDLQLPGGSLGSLTRAAFDSTQGYDRVAWNLVPGWVFMHSNGSLASTLVQARDGFDVIGAPPGTPVTLTVQLTVDGLVGTLGCGGSGCSGMYDAQIIHGAEIQEVTHSDHLFNGEQHHHDVLELPVTIVAGTPEVIGFQLYGHRNPGGSHYSEALGTISFAGLPPDLSIVSCEGYNGGATPAKRRSWGALKTMYR